MRRVFTTALCLAGVTACNSPAPVAHAPTPQPSDPQVQTLADTFLAAYFDRYPETATQYGVPGRRHDTLTDNSLEAQKAWEAREDAWLTSLKAIEIRGEKRVGK